MVIPIQNPPVTQRPFRHTPVRPPLLVVVALVAITMLSVVPVLLGVGGPLPGQRIDLRVLVIAPTAGADGLASWQSVLTREGVPFDTLLASTAGPLTDGQLADYGSAHARYQGVILTNGDLMYTDPVNGWSSAFSAADWATLNRFEATFGIRQISDNTDPSPAHGLNWPTVRGPLDGVTGTLTAAGHTVFSELNGPVPIQDLDPAVTESWGAQATPLDPGFTSLVDGPNGSSLVGTDTHADGREEMVVTVATNQYQLFNQLLRRGMINWLTRGVHLGESRNYFSMQIDDVFLSDAKWDPASHTTPGDTAGAACDATDTCPSVRMAPSDVAATLAFQNANHFRFDLAFNGAGYRNPASTPYPATTTVTAGSDPLADDPTNGLLKPSIIAQFGWINHTWSHVQLDLVPLGAMSPTPAVLPWAPALQGTLIAEIAQNIQFATAHNLPIDPASIVTGEHSGVGAYYPTVHPTGECGTPAGTAPCPQNPDIDQAFATTGIKWFGDDASAKPNQRSIGTTSNAVSVPRHPSNVYYNVATQADQLDEYNWVYYDHCTPIPGVTTCRTAPATWADYTASESQIMMGHVLGNDPRPHYAHQPNLMVDSSGNGILFAADHSGVMDQLFSGYDALFNAQAPRINPTLTEAGQILRDQTAWASAMNAPATSAYIESGAVHVTTGSALQVPVTGTTVGDLYAGHRSGWTAVNGTVTLSIDAATATAAPSVAGNAYVGQTLTATRAMWSGTPAPTVNTGWLRCDGSGAACVPVLAADGTPVTAVTYVPTTTDRGHTLRFAEVSVGTLIESRSNATAVVLEPKATTLAAIAGTPQVGAPLTATAGVWQDSSSLTRSWERCAADGTGCTAIVGATGLTYTPVATDRGMRLRLVETAVVPFAPAPTGTSALTAPVVDVRSLTPPVVSGNARVGDQLTVAPGTWGADVTAVTRAWQRCALDGTGCTPIQGATGLTYTPVVADRGMRLGVVETAGVALVPEPTATSILTDAVVDVRLITAPQITALAPRAGHSVSVTPGVWGADVTSVSREWQRCASGTCTTIPGATGTSYLATVADLDATLRVVETAQVSFVPAPTGTSNESGVVTTDVLAAPVVAGSPLVGQTLSIATDAQWDPAAVVGLVTSWVRCDATGGACVPITTAGTYVVQEADRGHTIRAEQTQTGSPSTARSAPSATILDVRPLTAPTVSGTARVGSTLTASAGTWGSDVAAVHRVWERCAVDGTACAAIPGATGLTYVLAVADQGHEVRVVETAQVAVVPAPSSASAPTGVVAAAPTTPTGPGSGAGSTGGPSQGPPSQRPVVARIMSLDVSPGRFVPARRPTDAAVPGRRVVATWTMSAAGRVTVVVQRRGPKGWRTLRSWHHDAIGGTNSLRYLGWLRGRPMAPGTARIVMWTTGANGRRTSTATRTFVALKKGAATPGR